MTRALCPGLIPNPIPTGVGTGIWDELEDATGILAYISNYGITLDGADEQILYWEPVIGNPTTDTLEPAPYIVVDGPWLHATDSDFGGYPSAYTIGVGGPPSAGDMAPAVPTSSTLFTQANDTILIVQAADPGAGGSVYLCSAASNLASSVQVLHSDFYLSSGVGSYWPENPPIVPMLLWIHWDNGSSSAKYHASDGTEASISGQTWGTLEGRGLWLFGTSGSAQVSVMRFMGACRCYNLSDDDWDRLIAWAQANMGWS